MSTDQLNSTTLKDAQLKDLVLEGGILDSPLPAKLLV